MADEDNLNEGFLKKAVRAVAGKRIAAGRAKEASKNQRAYGQDARATNGRFSDEDEKQLTRMQSTKRRYDRIANGEKPFRKAKQGEYISKIGEDMGTTRNIIEILASATPEHSLKEAVAAALSERVTDALNEYKQRVASAYFGQADLSEENLDEVTYSPAGLKISKIENKYSKRNAKMWAGTGSKIKMTAKHMATRGDDEDAASYDSKMDAYWKERKARGSYGPGGGRDRVSDRRYTTIERHTKARYDAKSKKAGTGHYGEDLQELSKGTLRNYVKRAADSVDNHSALQSNYAGQEYDAAQKGQKARERISREKSEYHGTRTQKRLTGINRAADRLAKEDTDLQELSKHTLGSYIKKASHDVTHKGAQTREMANRAQAERKAQNYVGARKASDLSDKIFDKSWNRRKNMAKAVDRLTKEEVMDEGKSLLTKGLRAVAGGVIARMRSDKQLKAADMERNGGRRGLNGTRVPTPNPDQNKIDRLEKASLRNNRISRGVRPFLTGSSHYMDDDLDEAKKQASIAQKNKAIKAFDKAGKYRPDSKLRYAPLKFKKDRKNARMNSQAAYASSPGSDAYESS